MKETGSYNMFGKTSTGKLVVMRVSNVSRSVTGFVTSQAFSGARYGANDLLSPERSTPSSPSATSVLCLDGVSNKDFVCVEVPWFSCRMSVHLSVLIGPGFLLALSCFSISGKERSGCWNWSNSVAAGGGGAQLRRVRGGGRNECAVLLKEHGTVLAVFFLVHRCCFSLNETKDERKGVLLADQVRKSVQIDTT